MHLDPRFKRSNILRGCLSAANFLASSTCRAALIAAIGLIASVSGGAQSAFADKQMPATAQIFDSKGSPASEKVAAACEDCCCKAPGVKDGLLMSLSANWTLPPFKGLELTALPVGATCSDKQFTIQALMNSGPGDSKGTVLTGVLTRGPTNLFSGDLVEENARGKKAGFPYVVRLENIAISDKCS